MTLCSQVKVVSTLSMVGRASYMQDGDVRMQMHGALPHPYLAVQQRVLTTRMYTSCAFCPTHPYRVQTDYDVFTRSTAQGNANAVSVPMVYVRMCMYSPSL